MEKPMNLSQAQSKFKGLGYQESVIIAMGNDDPNYFGGGFRGGYMIQQNPKEFAALICLLKERGEIENYLEIGIGGAGTIRHICDQLSPKLILGIDDGQHPQAYRQRSFLPDDAKIFQGDSHSPEARDWLREKLGEAKLDAVLIDGDHSRQGILDDFRLILPHCDADTLIMFHDTSCLATARAALDDLISQKAVEVVADFADGVKPIGISVVKVVY